MALPITASVTRWRASPPMVAPRSSTTDSPRVVGHTGNNNRCAGIATHGVKRDSNLLRHERPGNLISCGRNRLGRELNVATEAKRNPATLPGGDNTVSAPRHNLLTPCLLVPTALPNAIRPSQQVKLSQGVMVDF